MKTKERINRQERILSTLADLTFATRSQLQAIESLGGDRNARRILHAMESDKLIRSVRAEEKIYYVTNRGGGRIGRKGVSLKEARLTHAVMRNDMYLRLGSPESWRKEVPIKKEGEIYLVADAMFKRGGRYYFVEIDNEQTMRTNNDKIKRYADVFKPMFREYGHHPTLIWYSRSDIRREKLRKACEKACVNHEIY